MPVSFASYEIPRSGLWTNERGLTVTGHNIANVNTPGFVRQQAVLATASYVTEFSKGKDYQLGLGSDIQQVRQIRNSFLDGIYRQESVTQGYWSTINKTYEDIQSIMGEPMGTGLQATMDSFWNSWQELSKQPDSLTVRALVRQQGGAFVQQVNHLGDQLDKLQNDLNSELKVRIDELNNITSQISSLNLNILTSEITSDSANDYRDQRNTLLDKLSKLANVDINEMQDGQVDVTLGGYFLVQKGVHTNLTADYSPTSGLFYVPVLAGTNIEVPVKNGVLKGILESRGEVQALKGSPSNGSPHNVADINFVIDTSDTSASYLNKIQSNIASYINELNTTGMDYNLNLIKYDGTGSTLVGSYGNNVVSFTAALNNPALISTSANTGNNFASVVNLIDSGVTYRPGSNKYALIFTAESVDGNGTTTTDVSPYLTKLLSKDINTSIITSRTYYSDGDNMTESGWDSITTATKGKLYDINDPNFSKMLEDVAMNNVNNGISNISSTANILPDLKKRLNALVNIITREINQMHTRGTTLTGATGQDFFVRISNSEPFEMGNIKLNDNLLDLNYIVSSANGFAGDNTVALEIANLRHGMHMTDENGILSIDDYYQSIILGVGNNGANASRISSNQNSLVQSADNYRQSIVGVSMDEEMSNMMKYKFAYNAAAKALNAVDQMIESVITRLGLVGR